ncbi:MAG: AI-2E family transporter [Actinomycetota bacterium]|nr:AI-2E family transporter [Actinomycetota bacterium]
MSERPTLFGTQRMPQWVWKGVAVFWLGYLIAVRADSFVDRLYGLFILLLVSLFLSLAIEPGVNRLARRGWRRGTATAVILVGVLLAFLVFVIAVGALVGQQVADLLGNSEKYVNRTVSFLNDTFGTHINADKVIISINDENGAVQRFIKSQQGKVVDLSVAALGLLVQGLSVMLFTFYMVADGPKLRRSICSRLNPERQRRVLDTWELAIEKTGGYLYSRALLAGLSSLFHWIVLQSIGTPAPVALALWVGVVSQFLPVVGTYLAGALPVLVTFIDSPTKALAVLIAVLIYQQLENYLFLPRITARTMDLHPAVAFGSAIGGAAVLGAVGAVLAIPGAAMVQALLSNTGERHEVIETDLTTIVPRRRRHARRAARHQHPTAGADDEALVSPTDVSPTDVSPTDVSPTDVSPTDVSPTDVSPTDVSPTDVSPTDVSPTDVSPTDVPIDDVPIDDGSDGNP